MKKVKFMSAVMEDVEDGEAGEGGATNMSEASDVFSAYINSIIQTLLVEFEATEDDLLDTIIGVADELLHDDSMGDPSPV